MTHSTYPDMFFIRRAEDAGISIVEEVEEDRTAIEVATMYGGAFEGACYVESFNDAEALARAIIIDDCDLSEDLEVHCTEVRICVEDFDDLYTEPTGYGPYPRYTREDL